MTIQKNSKILVNVEEALADLIVVSYSTENKKFQGVLLDSNKGNLPYGVYSLNPAFSKSTVSTDSTDDKLHSASQRFTYQEPQYAADNPQKPKKPGPKGKPQQKQKMTVRLRARKVLCSNCKGICNENNENVDVSKKRKLESDDDISPNNFESPPSGKKYLIGSSLIPRIPRLQPNEITSAIKGAPKSSSKGSEKTSVKVQKSTNSPTKEMAFVSVPSDLENKDGSDPSFTSMFTSARTLKICFGEGEGTVVKIPPITGDYNEDSGVSCDMTKPSKMDLKVAKKALKKAKKQAKKNTIILKMGTRQSPKHIGALSPRNNVSNGPPTIDPLEKKHKHKMRFNKKKRGAYKEAVKLATIEAKMNESQTEDPLGSPTQASLVNQSPRPVDVFS
ncbi:hypothetical protein MSG28_009529 [Choristoneura fumiferana]|uniref:Uncharacterized protein n=1 Tax=Choristoneura fumiferana TaxID=7141 RepID=A0ACC0JBH8_CHOFU|nr:hypothetical protein MSG28_009529 [Choristoneura fumiferana]